MFPLRFWKKDEVSSSEEVVEVSVNVRNIDVEEVVARVEAFQQEQRDKELISLLTLIENALEEEYGSVAQFVENIEKGVEGLVLENGRSRSVLLVIDTRSLTNLPRDLIDEIDRVDYSAYPRFCMIKESPNIGFSTYRYSRKVHLEIFPDMAHTPSRRTFQVRACTWPTSTSCQTNS